MKALNCRLGDLALTVTAELPENLGNIVRIVGNHGEDSWFGFAGPTHLWEVEVIEGGRLLYEHDDGSREYRTTGLAPDAFLKPIAPRKRAEDHAEVNNYALA
jgi:hypothetical protein